jgi:REP-associated tyrosine transposase
VSRKLRIQYPGAIYHLMNRGDQREAIFRDDADRQKLLGTLGEACLKTEWQVHAYCLMSNPFSHSAFRVSGDGFQHLRRIGLRNAGNL